MIDLSIKFKQISLVCMLGASLAGCGGSDSDSNSQNNSATEEATVSKAVSALVQTAAGTALEGAEISIAGQTLKTDVNGKIISTVRIPQSAKSVIVTFKKAGFITQSVELKVEDLAQLTANLLPVKQTLTVAKIEDEQVIQAAFMNAQISIPANAFVIEGTTQAATGQVTVEFTPWDITGSDLNAMPANGVAVDAQGNPALLISAGMITATFTNSTGQKLQLKQGVSADIQMDLPLTSINNQAMTVGTSIPMWYFDPKTGKWKEEGTPGTVISSATSPTGLAVHATVTHFSTWNWDFKFENPGEVNVKCKSAATYVPCHITAKVELKDGSGLTKTSSIPAEGVDIVNMPTEGTIYWTAKDTTGTLIGSVTSQLPGDKNVVIDLGTPATSNKVSCTLENGTPVACSGKFITMVNGDYKDAEFTAPKEGVNVLTGLKSDDNELNWVAYSAITLEGDQWVRYRGSKVSGPKADVKIVLDGKDVVAADKGLSFFVQCVSDYDYTTGTWGTSNPELKGKPCEVQINVSVVGTEQPHTLKFSTIYGEKKLIRLPNQYAGFHWMKEGNIAYFQVNGQMLQGVYCGYANGTEGFDRTEQPLFNVHLYGGGIPSDNPEYFCQMPT